MFTIDDISVYAGVSSRGIINSAEKLYNGMLSPTINFEFGYSDPWLGLLNISYNIGGETSSNKWIPTRDSNAYRIDYGSRFYLSSIGDHHASTIVTFKQYLTHSPGYGGAEFGVSHIVTGRVQTGYLEIKKNMDFYTRRN